MTSRPLKAYADRPVEAATRLRLERQTRAAVAGAVGRIAASRLRVQRGSVQIVLSIGAAAYPLAEADARLLERAIRRLCVDDRGLPRDDDARACLQLADVLAEGLASGVSRESIAIGRSHVKGLCEYVLEDAEIAGVYELVDLCDALKRYRSRT